MSSTNDVKVATTYFPTQLEDARMKEFVTEPTLLRIIKFQKNLQ